METENFARALYYPHIFPQSRQWLRTAVLYHDVIGRIVPQGFLPTEYVRHSGPALLSDFNALHDDGFIEDNYPDQFLGAVADEFLDFIAPHLVSSGRKARLVALLGSDTWKPYNMDGKKISPELLQLLESEGLLRSVNSYEVEFDASIGGLYMVFLARRIAKHLPIVSDDPLYESLTQAPRATNLGNAADVGAMLATAVFRSAVPIDIESVEIRDLIKFRRDFADERREFYEYIASSTLGLAKITDSKQLKESIEYHGALIQRQMAILKRRLRLLRLKCAAGIFTASVPAYITAEWGFGATEPAILVTAASVSAALTVTCLLADHSLAKAQTPLSYVHEIKSQLAPKAYATKLIQLNLSSRQ